jgi:hypothetical protein
MGAPRRIIDNPGCRAVVVKVLSLSGLSFSGEYDAVTGFGIDGSITILQLLRIRSPVVK